MKEQMGASDKVTTQVIKKGEVHFHFCPCCGMEGVERPDGTLVCLTFSCPVAIWHKVVIQEFEEDDV